MKIYYAPSVNFMHLYVYFLTQTRINLTPVWQTSLFNFFFLKTRPQPCWDLRQVSLFSYMPVSRWQPCPLTCDVCTSLCVSMCIFKFFLTLAPLTSEIPLYILFHAEKKSIFSKLPTLTSADIDGKQPHRCSLSTAAAWNVGCTALHLIPYYSSDGAATGRLKKEVYAMTAPFVCVWSVCVHTFFAHLLHTLNAPSDPASKS